MLKNRKEMFNWLIKERRLDEETYVNIDRNIPKEMKYIPMKYEGIYDLIGMYTVWDEVGGIASSGKVYKPVKGGTILFEV